MNERREGNSGLLEEPRHELGLGVPPEHPAGRVSERPQQHELATQAPEQQDAEISEDTVAYLGAVTARSAAYETSDQEALAAEFHGDATDTTHTSVESTTTSAPYTIPPTNVSLTDRDRQTIAYICRGAEGVLDTVEHSPTALRYDIKNGGRTLGVGFAEPITQIESTADQATIRFTKLLGSTTEITINRPDPARRELVMVRIHKTSRRNKTLQDVTLHVDGDEIMSVNAKALNSKESLQKLLSKSSYGVDGGAEFLRELAAYSRNNTASSLKEDVDASGLQDQSAGATSTTAEEQRHELAAQKPADAYYLGFLRRYERFPPTASLSPQYLTGASILLAMSEGDTRVLEQHRLPSVQGKETGSILTHANTNGHPSLAFLDSVQDTSLPTNERVIIGTEKSINVALTTYPVIDKHGNKIITGDAHTHPGLQATTEQTVREGGWDASISHWGIVPQTSAGREILIHAIQVMPPSFLDIASASRHVHGGISTVLTHNRIYLLAPSSSSTRIDARDAGASEVQEEQNQQYTELIHDFVKRADAGEEVTKEQLEQQLQSYVERKCRRMRIAFYIGTWDRTSEAPIALDKH